MAFKEVCDCEILVSEIERRPALKDYSLKEQGHRFERQTVRRSVRGSRF